MYEKGEDEIHGATTDGAALQEEDTAQTSDVAPVQKQASLKKSPVPSKQKTLSKQPSKEKATKDSSGKGTLTLTVEEAKLTRDVDIIGKQDPFVELNLYNQFWSWKSKVIESGGKTPKWNETVIININS